MIAFLLWARFLLFVACGVLISLYLVIGWRSDTAK